MSIFTKEQSEKIKELARGGDGDALTAYIQSLGDVKTYCGNCGKERKEIPCENCGEKVRAPF